MHYAKCINIIYYIKDKKGENDIKKSHDYAILRQVFDMAREGKVEMTG